MKACPQCGFLPTMSNRKMLALLAAHFPGAPIMEMVKRGWIKIERWTVEGKMEYREDQASEFLADVLAALLRFFEFETEDELKKHMGWEGSLMETDG